MAVTPSFDFGDDESAWQEVPQARFLSWSPGEQAAYCAARDEDSAAHADNEVEELWFLERAQSYRSMSCPEPKAR